MLQYTACVRDWMAADPSNVIAIHCKGGKGLSFGGIQCWLWIYNLSEACNAWVLFNRADGDYGVHVAHRQRPVWECTGTVCWKKCIFTFGVLLIQDCVQIFYKLSYRRVWTTSGRDGPIKVWVRSSRVLRLPHRCVCVCDTGLEAIDPTVISENIFLLINICLSCTCRVGTLVIMRSWRINTTVSYHSRRAWK